jgi:pyruvate dehydrogenase E2 component (dihydrolipoamide acetyltransferase)
MATKVIMPQGGQDIEVGRVVRWLKAEGDHVGEGETLCEVETEKAVFEVPSPAEGYLRRIVVGEGEETPIFSVIGYVGDLGEEIPSDELPSSPRKMPTPAGPVREVSAPQSAPSGRSVQISPRARRLADEHGIAVELVPGTGPGGRVSERDVLAFLERPGGVTAKGSLVGVDGGRVSPMSRVQRVTAKKMQESKRTIPHFYLTCSVDMTEALRYRSRINEQHNLPEDERVTVTDLIVRACVLAFKECPELNSSVLDEENLVIWEDPNIGLAVAVDDELVVPVLDSANLRSLASVALARRKLVAKAKEGKQPSMAPARFTISNLGAYNVDEFHAIINPPEAAIVAVSSIKRRPVAIEGDVVGIRDIVNLSLSIDHRAVNGVMACRFLNAVRDALEDPARLE